MRHTPLVMGVVTAAMAFAAGPAFALPGDRAIDSSSPFRLNDRTLEPMCFVPGRFSNTDLDTHLVIGSNPTTSELHVSLSDGSAYSIDQVLVASPIDGYKVVNEFDTGTVNDDPDIDPGQTATGLTSNTRFVDTRDTIVCVSGDHANGDNEPYNQEAGGLVSAKNRPILTPKVTAFGVSAIENLNTYRIGFGYSADKWYTDPSGDPNRFFGNFVSIFPRADGSYDARRVNDVDKAGESWASQFPSDEADANDGQTFLFSKDGDLTAWADSRISQHEGRNLLTFLTQGDLPIKWTLRPSLAAPSSKRSATFTLADFFAWNKSWQDYYKGGPLPTMPLAPGTNSPAPDTSVTVIVNPPLTQPAPTPVNPAPAPVVAPVVAPAPAPIVNTTTVINKVVKKHATKHQRQKYHRCVARASRQHGKVKRLSMRLRCSKMPH